MTTVGYVTVAEADEYICTRYLSIDDLRRAWEFSDESDKIIYLQRSSDAINALPLAGRKSDCSQENAFPRWPSATVPIVVKWAQIENALSLADASAREDEAFYDKMWKYGVESYKIGNLSESSSAGSWGRSGATSSGITSARAVKFLQPYLQGGFTIE